MTFNKRKIAISAVAIGAALLLVNLYAPEGRCYAYPPVKPLQGIIGFDAAYEWSREKCLFDEQMSTIGGRAKAYRDLGL